MSAPDALDPVGVLQLEIAGQPLVLEPLDEAAAAVVLPALGHLSVPRPDRAAPRFRVWSDDQWVHPLWDPDEYATLRFADGGLAVSHLSPRAVEVFDPDSGLELWGTSAAFAAGDMIAHPASTATAAWLSTRGVQVLHVGAVVFDGVAVLLLGAGGAGKSTTTISCGLAGAGVVGDDLCAVTVDPGSGAVVVHSLYATLKLNPDSDDELGAARWPTLGETPKGKRVVAIDAPLRVEASAPVGAIVALRAPGTAATTATRLTPPAAVRALVPTALIAALASVALDQWFATAMRIARSVPAYELSVSWDLDRVVREVAATAARPS